MARNEAWVNVGFNDDTPQFAVPSVRQWWKMMGSRAYEFRTGKSIEILVAE